MIEKRFKKGLNLSCVDTETGKSYWYACNLCGLLNEFEAKCHKLKKDNEKLQELVDVSMKADEVFSVFDDLKYIESALTFLIDNSLETQCVEYEREDIHFVAERLRIVLRSLDNE